MEKLQKVLATINDSHVFFGFLIFLCGNVAHYFHRLDSAYISFTATVFGFVLGHAAWGQNGDK